MASTRREFLRASLGAGAAFSVASTLPAWATQAPLAVRYADLPRHFVFEYYPWYASDPWRHWQQWNRNPPYDIASNYVPLLGAYDSRSAAVIEQHARWMVESGVGALNLSWWGQQSFQDMATPLVMDVMKSYGIKVAFHLEPYAPDHGQHFAENVLYLLQQYGQRRNYDTLLLLADENGTSGAVFKGFRTLLPASATDCHGVTQPVADYTPDEVYLRQLDGLRATLRQDFDHVTFLADSTDTARAARAGFDGVAIYDDTVAPELYGSIGADATRSGLLFSFNINPGFDGIEPRVLAPGACFTPTPFVPGGADLDFSQASGRELAAMRAQGRIADSFRSTLAAQTDPSMSNSRRGFFLVYLTSFNEWHEGTAFEPMLDAAELLPQERPFGYHNPNQGDYRLGALSTLLHPVLNPSA